MEETPFFLTAIEEQYGLQKHTLHLLRTNDPNEKRLFRVDYNNKPLYVLRAYHHSFVHTDLFSLLSRYSSLSTWLQAQASLLVHLAQQGYPAPQVVPSSTGTLVATYQDWSLLMITFVEGNAREATPEKMETLGAALGHLHTLPFPETSDKIGISWWELHAAIPFALHQFDTQAQHIPTEWQEDYRAYLATFRYFQQRPPLASTLIHADCWAENGIRTLADEVTLIDWECAGLGTAIIDLGTLLLHCHFDQRDTYEHQYIPDYHPDPLRIAAVVKGYRRWRQPAPDELHALLEAVRFSIAWRGVWFLLLSTRTGWPAGLQQVLRRWRRWYTISEDIACISRACFEQ